MKAMLYGQNQPMWKANQMWRSARQKYIKRDLEITQIMTQSIFQGMADFSYNQNAMIIRGASNRINKRA
ncbi:MAG: hypothetical protein ACJAZW_002627 [Maritalea sp.]|jgi:hypothetical protein